MIPEPKCAVCGGPGRYVRGKDGSGGWCEDHVPRATAPWVRFVQALVVLAILVAALHRLGWIGT